ncbi:hypothetical protein [Dermacoccus nishinomiyaensis]|nr:hypothetical protein [Dermacoccus nishinomiyaensis]
MTPRSGITAAIRHLASSPAWRRTPDDAELERGVARLVEVLRD